MSSQYFPPLSSIIQIDALPEQLNSIQIGLDTIFDNLYFKNLQITKSENGDSAFYSLSLISYKEIGITIPGTEMKIVLNPGGDGHLTEIPVQLGWEWRILRYVKSFKTDQFSFSPSDLFAVLSKSIVQIAPNDLVELTIQSFLPNADSVSSVNQFIGDVNDHYGSSVPLPSSTDFKLAIAEAIVTTAALLQKDPFTIIYEVYIEDLDLDAAIEKLNQLFVEVFGEIPVEFVKQLIIPKINASLNVNVALVFPRTILTPVDENGDPVDETTLSMLSLAGADIVFSTETGIGFDTTLAADLNYPSMIGSSGFIIDIANAKLDLSRTRNIPEATADGRPNEFIGVFIQHGSIIFPTDWNHDPEDEGNTAELFVDNFLVGTGGISGTIGMRGTGPDPEDKLISVKFGQSFEVGLEGFELVFQQNSIISSDIHGWLKIPGFKDESNGDAVIDIDIHIGQDGEFNVVASSVPALKKIKIPGAFEFGIESVFFGREQGDDGRFYLGISGVLDITVNEAIGQFLPDKLDIKKMLIYDDGTFEFEGGKIVLPKAYEVKFGAATLSITGIHMGSYEKDNRKYKYFGFDGGVKVNPGGVEAHGKGIKYYYTVDGEPFDWFIRLESLSVDIIIPSGADPENAAVTIRGFLSIAEPRIPEGLDPESPLYETLKNSQEYAGGVSVKIPKFKGLEASAAMRLNPKVPAFIVDLGIEISTPILLGTTGLGIYGFRALFGKKYVATKTSAGVPEDGEWWQYYKAKIDPDYREGIQVSKFDTKNGFSFGAGVSLATASDSGKTFSSKLFFLLSLPDVFLFQGQAQFLKERIGLDANPDPPFYAIIAITKHSVEAGFGVNYKLRENGKIVTVDGVIELGFFWGNSSAWYVNVGRETPEDRRIQARLFDILNMYFYLMLSSGGIRLGAGVKFELDKKFGPISAELRAYIDTFGKISRRPKQIGGAIKMGGKVGIKICGFGFSVSGGATLSAEAPVPHIVTGEFEVCVKVLKKERCARFEFTWDFDNNIDTTRIPLLGGTTNETDGLQDQEDAKKVAKMTHMVTGETYSLAYNEGGAIGAPDTWITGGVDDYRVPVDAFMDIEFKKGVTASTAVSAKIGGLSTPAKHVEFSPPVRGKNDRVRHQFYLSNIEILYWDETSSIWRPYDFYNAMLALYDASTSVDGAVDQNVLQSLKWGYWQQQDPGMNNKLRLLATTPLSYASKSDGAYTIEDLGVTDGTIFCPGDPIPQTCVIFGDDKLYEVFPANTLRAYENVLFRIIQKDGVVVNLPFEGFDNGLYMQPDDMLEIYFNEPMHETSLLLNTTSDQVTISYYYRRVGDPDPLTGLPTYNYALLDAISYTNHTFDEPIEYTTGDYSIDYIQVTSEACPGAMSQVNVPVDDKLELIAAMDSFLSRLISAGHLAADNVQLYPANASTYEDFFPSPLYDRIPVEGDLIELTQGHISTNSMSFTITDNHGFECLYTFQTQTSVEGFDFALVSEVVQITDYAANDQFGSNNDFMARLAITINGVPNTVNVLITTCKPLSYSVNTCGVGLYKVCYLSVENFLLNQTIPTETEQEDANEVLFKSINETLQPIWRPNTAFAVRLTTRDEVYREGSSDLITPNQRVDTYGFRTAGPVGHFHQYPVLNGSVIEEQPREDYFALEEAGKADEYRLTTLRPYIDYEKSYPNADGALINAKPLFYNNAELKLFYLYNHVYHFYNNWLDYQHPVTPTEPPTPPNYIAQSSLEIRILNPAPSATPEEVLSEGFKANGISHTPLSVGFPPSHINSVNDDVAILNNLLLNGNPCAEPQALTPIDISSVKVMNLKPLKLYTAQFVAHYNARIGGAYATEPFESTVHSYVFQTSRYGSFAEQVNSYILKTGTPGKKAIFPLEIPTGADYVLAQRVMSDTLTNADDLLRTQYAEPLDQLLYGVLGVDLNKLQAAVCTEFNLVKAGEQLIGILIRNPEPFNNPKVAVNAGDPMLEVTQTGVTPAPVFNVLHSKDRSQMFVTTDTFEIDQDAVLEFLFRYNKYNGIAYSAATEDEIPVIIDLTNYPI